MASTSNPVSCTISASDLLRLVTLAAAAPDADPEIILGILRNTGEDLAALPDVSDYSLGGTTAIGIDSGPDTDSAVEEPGKTVTTGKSGKPAKPE